VLENIIANYLQLPRANAGKLIELLTFENHWQSLFMTSQEILTQADFIRLLQVISQAAWYQGADRGLRNPVIVDQLRQQHYYDLFKDIGLIAAVDYPVLRDRPAYMMIFGSSESNVKKRVASLRGDLSAGRIPLSQQIHVLGCNRELGISVAETEEESRRALRAAGKDVTEMNMMLLLISDMLISLANQSPTLASITVVPVEVVSTAKSRQEKQYVTTVDTVIAFKKIITNTPSQQGLTTEPIIAAYSSQPFVLRQQQDTQLALGESFQVIGVGGELSRQEFNESYIYIKDCCGEIARLIYLNFSSLRNRPEFQLPLTIAEKNQLRALVMESQR
jgi:hypothetical protein